MADVNLYISPEIGSKYSETSAKTGYNIGESLAVQF